MTAYDARWSNRTAIHGFALRRLASWIHRARMSILYWRCPATTLLDLRFQRRNEIRHAAGE